MPKSPEGFTMPRAGLAIAAMVAGSLAVNLYEGNQTEPKDKRVEIEGLNNDAQAFGSFMIGDCVVHVNAIEGNECLEDQWKLALAEQIKDKPSLRQPVTRRASRSKKRPHTPTPRPQPAPRLIRRANGPDWQELAMCESSGRADINTGNGYYGLYQFDLPTWREYGGLEYASRPDLASAAEQTDIAQRLYDARGPQPWPGCTAKTDWEEG